MDNFYLSHRAKAIKPSPTLAVSALAKKMKAEGTDVINFGVGEPDFNTPDYIKSAAIEAIENNFTRYTETPGIAELREAIAQKFLQDNNIVYQTDEILVSPGAKSSIVHILMAICDPRDEIIIPAPYWVSYPSQVSLVDGIPIIVNTSVENDFKLTAQQLQDALKNTSNAKALILNTPNNPTGSVYSEAELREIAEVCLENNILIIADEIYEKLVYDDKKHISLASLSEEIKNITITINGVSKAFAMTGWRLGYCAGPKDIIKFASRIQGHATSCVNSVTQKATVSALKNDDGSVDSMRIEFQSRRNLLVERLNEIDNVKCNVPLGAFYAMPNIQWYLENNTKGITNSAELCEYLLKTSHIAVVPGSAFGMEGFVRFSYANSLENINEGLKRFKDGLLNLIK